MAKTIIKELIIVLLLCLAIILVLGILLYEYVPMSKTVPTPVSYNAPEGIKKELSTIEQTEEQSIYESYEINESDLNNYKRTKDYKPGKVDPFSAYQSNTANEQNGSNAGNNGASNGSSNGGTLENNTNTGTNNNYNNQEQNGTSSNSGKLHPDKGTK